MVGDAGRIFKAVVVVAIKTPPPSRADTDSSGCDVSYSDAPRQFRCICEAAFQAVLLQMLLGGRQGTLFCLWFTDRTEISTKRVPARY